MESIREELECLRTEIKEKKLTKIKIYGEKKAGIKRFIKLIGGIHNAWYPHQNAVMFAIHNESYECAEAILEILKEKEQEEKEIKATLKSLYKDIAQFATYKNAEGDTEIVCATKSGQHILAMILLESVHDIIKGNEECTNCCGNAHGEVCRSGYNLLMLALQTREENSLLPSRIVDIVSKRDMPNKMKIAMGKGEPEIYGQTTNSIRLAATRGKIELLMILLKKFLPPEDCYRAFLEVGPPELPEVSAMASVLKDEDELILGFFESLRCAQKRNALLETLTESPELLNNFLHQKMRPSAIEYFREKELFKNSYLIPKPSELSRPMGLIFYNTFSRSGNYLEEAPTEAENLSQALESLGWGNEAIQTFPGWTFDELIRHLRSSIEQVRGSCSLFLLYITSHGFADNISGMPDKSKKKKKKKTKVKKPLSFGPINDIIDVITNGGLPEFIPKVLIFDVCRGELDYPQFEAVHRICTTAKLNNILVLNATILGEGAEQDLYTSELAKQIEELAGRNVSLQEIQMRVAARVKKTPVRDFEGEWTFQIPEMRNVADYIFLRRYDDYEHHCTNTDCRKDIKHCYRECLICNNCLRWYHPDCGGCPEDDYNIYRRSRQMYRRWKCLKCDELESDRRF